MPSTPVDPAGLTALSPLDGRYASKAAPLRDYLSESALIRYRTLVEVRWLRHLSDEPAIEELEPLDAPVKDVLNDLVDGFALEDARRVKALERAEADDERDFNDIQRMLVTHVRSRTASLIEKNKMSLGDRKWLIRVSQMLMFSVF